MNALASLGGVLYVRCPVPFEGKPCDHVFEWERARINKSARSSLRARFMDHARTHHPELSVRQRSIYADRISEGL